MKRLDSTEGNGDRRELLLGFLRFLLLTFKNDWKVIFPFESKCARRKRFVFLHIALKSYRQWHCRYAIIRFLAHENL
jgi:hypothetical protein